MPIELPLPVKVYLDAINTHNVDALNTCMTPDAQVHDPDDEQAADGLEAVKEWFRDNCLHYNLHVEAVAAQLENDILIVAVKTFGDFPGSPLLFDYHFSLTDDRITNIDIYLAESPSLATLGNSTPMPDNAKPQMTPKEIMAALSVLDYKLPEAALYAAEAQTEAMKPLLLAELQRFASGKPDSSEDGSTLTMFGIYGMHGYGAASISDSRCSIPSPSSCSKRNGLIPRFPLGSSRARK